MMSALSQINWLKVICASPAVITLTAVLALAIANYWQGERGNF